MSQELTSAKYHDPGSSDNDPQSEPDYIATLRPRRSGIPKGIMIIYLLFGLIGILGCFSAANGFVRLFSTVSVEDSVKEARAEGLSVSIQRKVREFEQKRVATNKKYFAVNLYMEITKVGLAAAMLLSVVLMVTGNPVGRKIALATCGFAICYHVVAGGVTGMIAAETGESAMALMTSAFDEAAADARLTYQERNEAKKSFERGISVGIILGIIVIVFIKAVFYSVIMVYLVQPHIKQLYGELRPADLEQQLADTAAVPAG